MLLLFLKVFGMGILLFLVGLSLTKLLTKRVYSSDILHLFVISLLFAAFLVYHPAATGLLGDRLQYELGSSKTYSELLDFQLDELIEKHPYEVSSRVIKFSNGATVLVDSRYFSVRYIYSPDYKTTYSFKYKADYETTLKYIEVVKNREKELDIYK